MTMAYAPALSPALWLALTGGALPQSVTPAAILECKAPRETAATAFDKGFPITKSIDRSVAPDLDITHFYNAADYTVFGESLFAVGGSHLRTPAKDRMIYMSVMHAPYPQVRAAVLEGHRRTDCLDEKAGACLVSYALSDGWERRAIVEEIDGRAVFTCTYERVAKKD